MTTDPHMLADGWLEISAEDEAVLLRMQAANPIADMEALERIVQARILRAANNRNATLDALRAVLQRWAEMADVWLDGEQAAGDGSIQCAVTREYLHEVRAAMKAVAPVRVQLSRRKGWRMPPNTVKVDRSTRWGNPFPIGEVGPLGRMAPDSEGATGLFRAMLDDPEMRAAAGYPADLSPLRGRNLGCWCAGPWCHADVLLDVANRLSCEDPIA